MRTSNWRGVEHASVCLEDADNLSKVEGQVVDDGGLPEVLRLGLLGALLAEDNGVLLEGVQVLLDTALADGVAALKEKRLVHEFHAGEAAQNLSESPDEDRQLAKILVHFPEELLCLQHQLLVLGQALQARIPLPKVLRPFSLRQSL